MALPAAAAKIPTYTCAIDLFEAARAASLDIESTRRKMERVEQMKAAESLRAQTYEAVGRGGVSDPTSRIDRRIDLEGIYERRLDEDYELVALADMVIYGRESGRGGVERLLGPDYADVLHFRYCAAETWGTVSDRVGRSDRWCREACRIAMEQIDAYGVGRMLDGLGIADDDTRLPQEKD